MLVTTMHHEALRPDDQRVSQFGKLKLPSLRAKGCSLSSYYWSSLEQKTSCANPWLPLHLSSFSKRAKNCLNLKCWTGPRRTRNEPQRAKKCDFGRRKACFLPKSLIFSTLFIPAGGNPLDVNLDNSSDGYSCSYAAVYWKYLAL